MCLRAFRRLVLRTLVCVWVFRYLCFRDCAHRLITVRLPVPVLVLVPLCLYLCLCLCLSVPVPLVSVSVSVLLVSVSVSVPLVSVSVPVFFMLFVCVWMNGPLGVHEIGGGRGRNAQGHPDTASSRRTCDHLQ